MLIYCMPRTHHGPALGSELQCPHSGIQTDQVASFQNILSPCAKRKRALMSHTLALKASVWEVTSAHISKAKQVPWQHLTPTRPRSRSYHVPEKRIRNTQCAAPMTYTLAPCRPFTLSSAHMSRFTINGHGCKFTQQSLLKLSSFFFFFSLRFYLFI